MDPRPDFCPGCGAQVYPEETHCPFCGRSLRSSAWFPFLLGLGGMGAALVVGALVWWVLDGVPSAEPGAPPVQQEAGSPPPSDASPQAAAAAPQPGAAQAAAGPQAAAGGAGTPNSAFAALPGVTAPVAGFAPPPDAPMPTTSTKDNQRFAPGAVVATAPAVTAATTDAPLPLPSVHGTAPQVASDAADRRAFAQTTQERFVENGLDLTVKTSGTDDTTITITFNFPAKTAAELIVAGPFPNQCAQRGFTEVIFVDPSGLSWLYDMTTKQLTQRQ